MGAQLLSEIYRTNEGKGTYMLAVTIVYAGDVAYLYGLDESPSLRCLREIRQHLRSRGVSVVRHERFHNGRFHPVEHRLRKRV